MCSPLGLKADYLLGYQTSTVHALGLAGHGARRVEFMGRAAAPKPLRYQVAVGASPCWTPALVRPH